MRPGAPESSEVEGTFLLYVKIASACGTVLMGTEVVKLMGHAMHLGNDIVRSMRLCAACIGGCMHLGRRTGPDLPSGRSSLGDETLEQLDVGLDVRVIWEELLSRAVVLQRKPQISHFVIAQAKLLMR